MTGNKVGALPQAPAQRSAQGNLVFALLLPPHPDPCMLSGGDRPRDMAKEVKVFLPPRGEEKNPTEAIMLSSRT